MGDPVTWQRTNLRLSVTMALLSHQIFMVLPFQDTAIATERLSVSRNLHYHGGNAKVIHKVNCKFASGNLYSEMKTDNHALILYSEDSTTFSRSRSRLGGLGCGR